MRLSDGAENQGGGGGAIDGRLLRVAAARGPPTSRSIGD
jgi:hypothetical protein